MRPTSRIVLLLALLGLGLAPCAASTPRSDGHPSDGPDVDLRVRLEEGRVTLQAIMNLAFCDEIAGSPRRSDEDLTAEELSRLRQDLLKVFGREVELAVDGIPVAPSGHEFAKLPFDPALAENFPQMGMLAVIKLRLTLVYTLKSDPRTVGLTWRLHPIDTALADFVETPIEVKAEWTAFGDVSIVELPVDRPEYVWRAAEAPARRDFLAVPTAPQRAPKGSRLPWLVIGGGGLLLAAGLLLTAERGPTRRGAVAIVLMASLALLGYGAVVDPDRGPPPAAPVEAEARTIFAALHANIYRAFDYAEEEKVYDALARSVTGELLDEVYNEIYRSLVLQEHGGAVCRVDEVERLATEVVEAAAPAPPASFLADARWRVRGQVYHWGHTHERTNEYRAEYRVAPTPSGWRIDRARVIEQFRVSATSNGGSVSSSSSSPEGEAR